MKRKLAVIVVALLGLALAASRTTAAIGQSGILDSTVYTVPEVQAELARHPGAWQGRAIRLRGTVMTIPCPVSACPIYFQEARRVASVPLLFPRLGIADPWRAALRRIPTFGTLVPRPQQVDYGAVAVYRVLILAVAPGMCARQCYAAVLLDPLP